MQTILLIEDNLEIRENTTEILELAGYEVLTAANGKEGIAVATEKQPGLILCDIMMPEMDGYETFSRLQQNTLTSSIPFIFLTASVEKKDIKAGFDMGAAGYIRKPFEPKELLDTISACLKKSKAF